MSCSFYPFLCLTLLLFAVLNPKDALNYKFKNQILLMNSCICCWCCCLNGIKTLLANGWTRFFITGKPTFINAPRSLPRNSANCITLDIWVFDNFILACKLFLKDDLQLAFQLVIVYVKLSFSIRINSYIWWNSYHYSSFIFCCQF